MDVPEELLRMLADFIEVTHFKGRGSPEQDAHITFESIYWRIFRRTNSHLLLSSEAQRHMETGRRKILRRALAKLVKLGQVEVYRCELGGKTQNCFRPFDVLNELAKI